MGDLVAPATKETDSTTTTTKIDIPHTIQPLTPLQLLHLGSVWFSRPEDENEKEQQQANKKNYTASDMSSLPPPRRLTKEDALMELQQGDYMRIHHTPRRFTNVHQAKWNARDKDSVILPSPQQQQQQQDDSSTNSNGGFWIIDKPPLIPVHATVDNAIENVVHQLQHANTGRTNNTANNNNATATVNKDQGENEEVLPYVATTQRIDINTSGLLVVATQKDFAAYFAALLRNKTIDKTSNGTTTSTTAHNEDNQRKHATIEKGYRCLVCLQQPPTSSNVESSSSIYDEYQRLLSLQNTTIRHYLAPSIRAPKRFETTPGDDNGDDDGSSWLECLLTITKVSPVLYPTLDDDGDSHTNDLVKALWTGASKPTSSKAICELEIQLGTGRTHQIRGQLAKLGFPLVGDEQYGGAVSSESQNLQDPQLLALQCCHVGFWDPDYITIFHRRSRKNVTRGIPSNRWMSTTLESAWWTPLLLKSTQQAEESSITSQQDLELLQKQKQEDDEATDDVSSSCNTRRFDLLPPPVQLSPGRNKYVLIRVDGNLWFVRSASPNECGGPYHANVAQDLIEWIQAAGYEDVVVTGGGRIDYTEKGDNTPAKAHVYGFSYGYGKGDHARVAQLIQQEGGILATYDSSNSLY